MRKDNSQLFQEISQRYGLDSYPKDEYTQAMIKEFRKYGTKLLKIENYEEMQSRGIELQSDLKDLINKKAEFQQHLSSLQRALDIYTTVQVPQNEKCSVLEEVAKLLVMVKINKKVEKLNVNPLSCDISRIVEMFDDMISLKAGEETTIKQELVATKDYLLKLCKQDISEFNHIFNSERILNLKFKIQTEPLLRPPGLDLDVDNMSQGYGAEIPPDPSTALPVSVLVAGVEVIKEEVKGTEGEAGESGEVIESDKTETKDFYDNKRHVQRRGRRARRHGYIYVKRSELQ